MTLSLWKKTKGRDYALIDRLVLQSFKIGGVDIYVRKYVKPVANTKTVDPSMQNFAVAGVWNETSIQDTTFGENRDRIYEEDYRILRGHYEVVSNDFELMQFGLGLADGSIIVYLPLNHMVDVIGRKLMSGDVLEFENLREDLHLDEDAPATNRFYYVTDASYPSDGYSRTWLPHVWRLKAKPLTDSREFADILGTGEGESDLRNLMSEYRSMIALEDGTVAQAAIDVDRRKLETAHFYIVPGAEFAGENPWLLASDGIPPNDATVVDTGDVFPTAPVGSYFLRTDYDPMALFKREENTWRFVEYNLREEWSAANRTLESFINNDAETTVGTETTPEQQFPTKAVKNRAPDQFVKKIRPKADE